MTWLKKGPKKLTSLAKATILTKFRLGCNFVKSAIFVTACISGHRLFIAFINAISKFITIALKLLY